VDQKSGSTQLSCSYAREPFEGSEFLGVKRPGQQVQQRAPTDAQRITVVAAQYIPARGAMGPNGGTIVNVVDVTQAYTGQTLPLYQGPPVAGTTTPSISVKVGVTQVASAYPAAVLSLANSSSQQLTFYAFRLTEMVPRYLKQQMDLPVEEYIRPGWYGDCWHPALIGQVYQGFFGTGSICDQQQADSSGGASIGVTVQAATDALQKAQKAVDADDPNGWAAALYSIDSDSSIDSAVAFILNLYSRVKQQGLDTDAFINGYVWRPIATMTDMFGTADLQFDSQGKAVILGIEGFHSRAFGPYANLFGLVTPNITSILGVSSGSPAAQRMDTRQRKYDAVQAYVGALSGRAILG
jgi:hypothetical protein